MPNEQNMLEGLYNEGIEDAKERPVHYCMAALAVMCFWWWVAHQGCSIILDDNKTIAYGSCTELTDYNKWLHRWNWTHNDFDDDTVSLLTARALEKKDYDAVMQYRDNRTHKQESAITSTTTATTTLVALPTTTTTIQDCVKAKLDLQKSQNVLNLKPDLNQMECYQHGFFDAKKRILDILAVGNRSKYYEGPHFDSSINRPVCDISNKSFYYIRKIRFWGADGYDHNGFNLTHDKWDVVYNETDGVYWIAHAN